MTSRLSSLLVRDGVVAVRRMEKAFQRQVLFGGGLDTILLEMNELPEQRLVQYLSMATGLPPATARELDGADPRAASRCSRDLAERFAVVPLWFEGEALRVVTRDPVDLGALEILANELEVAIQPFVAPEFRYELAFDKVYGRPSDERFTRLADASRLSAIPPAARSPSVVVESAATKSGSIPLPNQARAGAALGSAPAAASGSPSGVASGSSSGVAAESPSGVASGSAGGVASGSPSGVASGSPSGVAAGSSEAGGWASSGRAIADGSPPAASSGLAAASSADRAVTEIDASVASGPITEGDGASGPATGRRTLEMTPEAVRQRREEVERRAADAYRRHTGAQAAVELPDGAGEEARVEAAVMSFDGRGQEARVEAAVGAPHVEGEEARGAAAVGAPHVEAAVGSFDGAGEEARVEAAVMSFDGRGQEARAEAAIESFDGTGHMAPAEAAVGAPHAAGGQARAEEPGALELEAETAPSVRAPTAAELAGMGADAEAAPVVVIEYETSEAMSLAVTAPFARVVDDRPDGIVSGEIRPGDPSAPPVIDAAAAPSAPLAVGDSAATAHPFRHVGFDPAPLEIGEARELLVRADHRDQVFEVLLRAVRARTWYVALLTVQGGAAIGRVAIAGDEVDNAGITQVLIPLDVPSSFRQTVSTSSPYIGPVQTGDADIDGMIRRMGGIIPPSALLMPLILRNRVVALLIGHRGGDMLRVTEVSELLPLAAAASDALSRIIRRGKRSRQMPAVLAPAAATLAEGGVPDSVDEGAPTTRMAVVTGHDGEPDTGTATDPRAARPDVADASPVPLAQQLLDPDPRVRDAAVERLSSGPRAQLEEALAGARAALASEDLAEVGAAASAVAALADVRSIPPLLDAHARGGGHARAATRALVSLTKQDLGDSTRKWRQWWDKNRRKNRIEWLLEGLSHKETEIRRSAVDELRRATGEFFGYHPDLPRREREQARQRWIVWWQETGRLRFLPEAEPERAQATGSSSAPPREY